MHLAALFSHSRRWLVFTRRLCLRTTAASAHVAARTRVYVPDFVHLARVEDRLNLAHVWAFARLAPPPRHVVGGRDSRLNHVSVGHDQRVGATAVRLLAVVEALFGFMRQLIGQLAAPAAGQRRPDGVVVREPIVSAEERGVGAHVCTKYA